MMNALYDVVERHQGFKIRRALQSPCSGASTGSQGTFMYACRFTARSILELPSACEYKAWYPTLEQARTVGHAALAALQDLARWQMQNDEHQHMQPQQQQHMHQQQQQQQQQHHMQHLQDMRQQQDMQRWQPLQHPSYEQLQHHRLQQVCHLQQQQQLPVLLQQTPHLNALGPPLLPARTAAMSPVLSSLPGGSGLQQSSAWQQSQVFAASLQQPAAAVGQVAVLVTAVAATTAQAGASQASDAGYHGQASTASGVTAHSTVIAVQAAPASATDLLTDWLVEIRPQDVKHSSLWGKSVRLGRMIAKGGFSVVYEGHTQDAPSSSGSGRSSSNGSGCSSSRPPDCAVKVFTVIPGATARILQQLVAREVKALQVMQSHPSVVKLLAVGQLNTPYAVGTAPAAAAVQAGWLATSKAPEGSSAFVGASSIVLELLPQSLEKRLQQHGGPMPESDVQQHMRDLLRLLADMHSGRCGAFAAHRDVKPANMLLRADGSLAMADLGFASVSEPTGGEAAQMPEMCSMLGTPAYVTFEMAAAALAREPAKQAIRAAAATGASPDPDAVAQLSSYKYDCSVDIHAAGITCLELLVGGLRHMRSGLSEGVDSAPLWRERVSGFVDYGVGMPACASLSAAARAFVGCCCGVGRAREEAVSQGGPRRLTAEQLLQHEWLRV